MELDNVINLIKSAKIIAVIRANDPDIVRELARAYVHGGIKVIELTTSIPRWKTVLADVLDDIQDEALIGLGTVTSPYDAADAIKLGARFIVTPYVSIEVIEQVDTETSIPVIPGALTPSEIAQAYELGANMVKVFPASAVGGPDYIKALLSPMPNWELIPTGGVTPENAIDFIRAGAAAVGLGSNLAPKELVKAENYPAIAHHIRNFIDSFNSEIREGASK